MTNDTMISTEQPGQRFDAQGYSWFTNHASEYKTFEQGNFICDLSHLGFLRASGSESIDYLHGQLTNDVQRLSPNESQINGYCSPKGRLINIFRIHRPTSEGLILQARRDTLEISVDRLRKFVMRAKVELDVDDTMTSFGVVGERVQTILEGIVGTLPVDEGGCKQHEELTLIRHPSPTIPRFQVITTAATATLVWEQLSESCSKVGSWAWALLDITNGLATVFPATIEHFIPQTLNMDITNGLNFNKGCYPGQEIVARMHYLGKVKTRMVLGDLTTQVSPRPGEKIYGTKNDQSIGTIVDCVPAESGYKVLATARLENAIQNDLRLNNTKGAEIRTGDLPYAIEL